MRLRGIQAKWVGFTAWVVALTAAAGYSFDWGIADTLIVIVLIGIATAIAVELDRMDRH